MNFISDRDFPELRGVVVGAGAEDVSDGVPGERPDDGLVGVLDDARLLVLAHVPKHDGAVAAAAGEDSLVHLTGCSFSMITCSKCIEVYI